MLSGDVAMDKVTLVPEGTLPEKVNDPHPVLSVVASIGCETQMAWVLKRIVGALTAGTLRLSDVLTVMITCQYLKPVNVKDNVPFGLENVCVLGLPIPELADVYTVTLELEGDGYEPDMTRLAGTLDIAPQS